MNNRTLTYAELEEMKSSMKINTSFLTLRKLLGILGLLLPVILLVGSGFHPKSSISHYYYSTFSVAFTGVFIAFGLFLLAYRGYTKEEENISDNTITNLGGICAILLSFIPTASVGYLGFPNGHNSQLWGSLHLFFASLFILITAWMSYFRFTKGNKTDPISKNRNMIYKLCGITILACVLVMGSIMFFNLNAPKSYVFIGEFIAMIFFGISWLTKGEALKIIGL